MAIKQWLSKAILGLCAVATLVVATPVQAQTEEYVMGQITVIFETGERDTGGGVTEMYQTANVRVLEGPDADKEYYVEYSSAPELFEQRRLEIGDKVILAGYATGEAVDYVIVDKYRLPAVFWLAALFFGIALAFGRKKGVTSVLGLMASIAILVWFVVPRMLNGGDPFWTSIIGGCLIAIVSILLAHGFNKRSYIALGATLVALVIAAVLAVLATNLASLSGGGTEEALFLQMGAGVSISLHGLLMGAIIIGALGVLDDVTTAQVAAIEEIHEADPSLGWTELYRRGISVGKEHIASLVNTLVLAYVGASFPLFLLFSTPGGPPVWVVLNSETIMEEIVRAFVGGAALMLAVPIATYFAATLFAEHKKHR